MSVATTVAENVFITDEKTSAVVAAYGVVSATQKLNAENDAKRVCIFIVVVLVNIKKRTWCMMLL